MYLSRLILNPRSRRVQREIANPYQMHRTLLQAFPDDLKEGDERVLFRLEQEPAQGNLVLLVQSWGEPAWAILSQEVGPSYLAAGVAPNPAVKTFDLALSPGQALAFRLLANPTVKRKGKRLGIYDETGQMQWLQRKAAISGFRIVSARASGKQIVSGHIRRQRGGHRLRFLSVQFDGILQVTDPRLARESVRRGIGSGKGLGFGLLSLAPVSL